MSKAVILFDSECILCSRAVIYIASRDRRERYTFSSLESDFSREFLSQNGLGSRDYKTLYLIENGKIFDKSDAVINILWGLGGIYKFSLLGWFFPGFIRNSVYNLIALYRHRLYPGSSGCMTSCDKIFIK